MRDLPLPPEQLHGADAACNPQDLPISPRIHQIRWPTLGSPALLTDRDRLRVVLSLPEGESPDLGRFSLEDRHRGNPTRALSPAEAPRSLGVGPGGRESWLVLLSLEGVAPALYDLALERHGEHERQPNSVRLYTEITGEETLAFAGDSQYHSLNRRCLERWVARLNAREDIAWVALVGDVCDNNVCNPWHMLKLSAGIGPGPVVHHYAREYPESHAILSTLRHPIVLVPGNHDGMVAYQDYALGEPTEVYLGADPRNRVAYDGLQHYRCTFGPLYFAFDWAGTRYIGLNSFDLPRHQRLGYHAVVANWGGGIGPEQLGWLQRTLEEATALGLQKVIFSHHDPRGGSVGAALGRYHDARPFTFTGLGPVLKDYLAYLMRHGRERWQQEWMRLPGQEGNPARELLTLLARHEVRAVVMGHDNLNWFERYAPGDDIFAPRKPEIVHYRDESLPEELERLVPGVARALARGDAAEAVSLLDALSPADAALVAEAAATARTAEPLAFGADDDEERWRPELTAPLTFLHVDDIGAYAYDNEDEMRAFGYVEIRLQGGAPTQIRAFNLEEPEGPPGAWQPVVSGGQP